MKLEKCKCCAATMSSRAAACPICGDRPHLTFHDKIVWVVVLITSMISLLGIFWALLLATDLSAPQQCAIISGFIGFTLMPYCYARAVEKF